ncbi:MAG TPA: tRNA (adenosine(37)-N6)-threonylcarbamoyltransferase complex dimerization subunit type 1 TsaB, partial [Azospirillum sp.]
MKVLGLDTATSGCSAAVWDDGRVTARRAEPMARGQAEALVPMVQAVLADAGVTVDGLDRIAVTVGPGAFTGLRIALAAARGFALAAGLPIVGLTTFEAVAHALPMEERRGRRVLVAIDSRRAEPFLQLFDDELTAIGEPALLEPAAVPAWLPAGPLLVAG